MVGIHYPATSSTNDTPNQHMYNTHYTQIISTLTRYNIYVSMAIPM
jgi:hypothetical protein